MLRCSRARVYVLKSLDEDALMQVISRGLHLLDKSMSQPVCQQLIALADGDARRLLNILEIAAQLAEKEIFPNTLAAASGEQLRRFDKGGDIFFEQISALHKSVRVVHLMLRCIGSAAYSMAAQTRAMLAGDCYEWRARILAMPIRARCSSPSRPWRPLNA